MVLLLTMRRMQPSAAGACQGSLHQMQANHSGSAVGGWGGECFLTHWEQPLQVIWLSDGVYMLSGGGRLLAAGRQVGC
jgi:hypothetical protein